MKKILLVDVGFKLPNLALMKLSTYFKSKKYHVDLQRVKSNYYETVKEKIKIDATGYESVYVSIIFTKNRDILEISNCEDIHYGGSGYDVKKKLPKEIDDLQPDYSIYPDNKFSFGFITRGCVRNCYFCIVPKKEGMLYKYNEVKDIAKHKIVLFFDNNILAYNKHEEELQNIIDLKIKCSFNQGLDIRLINDTNAKLISKINYYGEYFFAFDNIKDEKLITEKLLLFQKYITGTWKSKFFLYCHPDMDIQTDILHRIKWCKTHEVLPYLMRDESCWGSKYKNFFIDLAAWCNQPSFFKKLTFEQFIMKRSNNKDRQKSSIKIYRGK